MPKAVANAKLERAEMQKIIDKEKGGFKLAPYDWFYYAEKVRLAKYDLDESAVRPYLELEHVKAGLFETMGKLFGITFIKRADLPGYAEGVTAYEIHNLDGSLVGVAYFDYYARANKRGGAWMNSWRDQQRLIGDVHAMTINVCSFAKATPNQPSLLSFDDTQTLFHEFGHALHGLLSNVKYPSVSGTNVPRDYVEFPSQVMENWVLQPQVLKSFAKHYQTGETIPDALIQKISNASKFNQGFASTEYLAASILDMDWHTLSADMPEQNAQEFEKTSLKRMGLIDEINPRYRTTYFNHIFPGGYSAGYYSYIWSEVMDADTFSAFSEKADIFDPVLSKSLRDNIFSVGNSRDPLESFKAFRGREPKIDALLERRGLK
jgi:peptidyl-dipeptidase Dcp